MNIWVKRILLLPIAVPFFLLLAGGNALGWLLDHVCDAFIDRR